MQGTKEQILSFFEKCEELKKCKFIMATTKIKDILKSIVNCPDLYELFSAVTKNFNYPAARAECLITVSDGTYARSYVALPQTVGKRLAFIFCLLVEFDKDTLNFNDFLQRYFPEDGSYFASYHAFCDVVIMGMQDAIAQVFKEELEAPEPAAPEVSPIDAARYEIISAINISISDEMQFISINPYIPAEEKEGALAMLFQLLEAVKVGNEQLINALIFGYNYFVLYNKCVSDGVAALIEQISAFERTL